MISKLSSLSPKLYLNSLVYHWNIFRSSSKVFGNLLDIFGNREFSDNVQDIRLAFGTILENLRKSSESGWKSSENHQKSCHHWLKYNKKEHYTLARKHEFYVLVARTISHEWEQRASEILFLPREHIKIHIFSPPCNILYITQRIAWRPTLITGEKRCVTTLITAARETNVPVDTWLTQIWVITQPWMPK